MAPLLEFLAEIFKNFILRRKSRRQQRLLVFYVSITMKEAL